MKRHVQHATCHTPTSSVVQMELVLIGEALLDAGGANLTSGPLQPAPALPLITPAPPLSGVSAPWEEDKIDFDDGHASESDDDWLALYRPEVSAVL